MNTTEVAVPQPWRDLMQEQNDRITALKQQKAKFVAALKEIGREHKCTDGQFRAYAQDTARAVLKEIGEL